MTYNESSLADPANTISHLAVSATHDAAATPVPDPGKCGDLAFLSADIAGGVPGLRPGDCWVDMLDFAMLADYWLECTDPADPVDCATP